MKFYNGLTRQKETFTPIRESEVGFYVCGPTVYDTAHLGNARPVVIFDVLYRLLKLKFKKVTYVRNITDIDDKIFMRAQRENTDITTVTTRATKQYHADMAMLNALKPDEEPRATTHIKEMLEMISTLIDKGHAYAADGHVLFDIKSYKQYGALARRSLDDMISGARVEVAPYKKDAGDFVLWKPSTDDWPGWKSSWGYGRPGWHIECSAMSRTYLGDTFDIHAGGIDLIFPHHENEVAQSCCANGTKKMANYWLHNGHLTVDGQKMSKSLGNFITVQDLLEKGVQGEVIRLAMLQTHYRQPFDWTDKTLIEAKSIVDRLYQALRQALSQVGGEQISKNIQPCEAFLNALEDDLNTPSAIRYMQDLAQQIFKSENAKEQAYLSQKLLACGNIIGLLQTSFDTWFQGEAGDNSEIEALIDKRNDAKKNRDFTTADLVRKQLTDMGIVLEDSKDGTTWRRR